MILKNYTRRTTLEELQSTVEEPRSKNHDHAESHDVLSLSEVDL
jgi:hypothetical protein